MCTNLKLWDAGAAYWALTPPHSLHTHSTLICPQLYSKECGQRSWLYQILTLAAHSQFEERWPEQARSKPKENCSQTEPPVLLASGKSRRKMGQWLLQSKVSGKGWGGGKECGSWRQDVLSHGPSRARRWHILTWWVSDRLSGHKQLVRPDENDAKEHRTPGWCSAL